MLPRCVVIGASAGGLAPLREVVSVLPPAFAAPVFVAMHVAPFHHSLLPDLLSRAGDLRAIHPQDGEKVEPGTVYVAPPDHHLLVADGAVAVKRGPKENGFRPSIDALFRSAAYSYGPGAIGVVLSGALNDGTSGLWSIKRLGGIAIVQEPDEAKYPSMPRSAMEYVEPDYRAAPGAIGALLDRLVQEQPARQEARGHEADEDIRRVAIETQIAAGAELPEEVTLQLGELTPFTCPECRGVLTRITEGNGFRFRCHTGHGFTTEALLEGLLSTVNDLVWEAMRGSQETSMLLEHMARHLQQAGDAARAKTFRTKSQQLSRQASQFQRIALEHESLNEEGLLQPPDEPGDGQPSN